MTLSQLTIQKRFQTRISVPEKNSQTATNSEVKSEKKLNIFQGERKLKDASSHNSFNIEACDINENEGSV